MMLLQAIVSVIMAVLLLSVLIVGLLLILKPLQGVRGSLEQVAMGVRAIESHAKALPEDVEDLSDSMAASAEAVGRAATRAGTVAEPLGTFLGRLR